MPSTPSSSSFSLTSLPMLALYLLTLLAVIAGGIYITGYADDVAKWGLEKYYRAEAKAEAKALAVAGQGKAEGFLKEQLKKNPAVSNQELNEVAGGLGDEAEGEGVKGLGDKIGKAFD